MALLVLASLFFKELRVLWLPFIKGLEGQNGVLTDLSFPTVCCMQVQVWMGR